MSLNIGQRIDEMFKLEVEITKAEVALKKLKDQRAALEARMLLKFEAEDLDGTKGRLAIANVKTARFPTIKQRNKFDKYVERTGSLHLFQNRIMSKAYFEMLEEGERIPGVEIFKRTSISITKRG